MENVWNTSTQTRPRGIRVFNPLPNTKCDQKRKNCKTILNAIFLFFIAMPVMWTPKLQLCKSWAPTEARPQFWMFRESNKHHIQSTIHEKLDVFGPSIRESFRGRFFENLPIWDSPEPWFWSWLLSWNMKEKQWRKCPRPSNWRRLQSNVHDLSLALQDL